MNILYKKNNSSNKCTERLELSKSTLLKNLCLQYLGIRYWHKRYSF